MLAALGTHATCATAWLAAAEYLVATGGEAYNLVIDVDDPVTHTAADRAVVMGLDDFLRGRRVNPAATVANTIFPQDLYRRHGPDAFVAEYLRAYDAIRKKGWGRYFERMVRWPGDGGATTDQLHALVGRLRGQRESAQTYRHVYEMTLFDPARDAARNRNRQCMSFLSFKLHPTRGLMLTAMYRNHHYISRTLGNLIGLGNLMAYIAGRVGVAVGPLTCVSTHAEVDVAQVRSDPDRYGDGCLGWSKKEAQALVEQLSKVREQHDAS